MPIAPRISARTQPAPYVAFGGVATTEGEKRCLFLGVLLPGLLILILALNVILSGYLQ